MITYPESVLGCPQRSSYSISNSPSMSALKLLQGRSRYRLTDTNAVYIANISFDMSAGQFSGWQSFWQITGNGTDWFRMRLILDVLAGTEVDAHAVGAFSASRDTSGRWQVALQVEAIPV